MAPTLIISIISLVIAGISLVIAGISLWMGWRKNVKDREYTNDKELVEQLKQSLELAYCSLAPDDAGLPTNNRLRWLTAARHIARYRQLQSSLATPLYKIICEEHEEYWRNRVYTLLARIDSSSFFEAIDPEAMQEEWIEPRSAAIIFSFTVWKEGASDPLDSMNFEEIVKKYDLFSPRNRHLRQYIEKRHPRLAEKAIKSES